MAASPITDRAVERWLLRQIVVWAVAGVALAASWGLLASTLAYLAFGFWIGYAVAGAVLGALALQHWRHASSGRLGLVLAAGVPAVAVGLWYGAGWLRAGGAALIAWVSAI
jgi:hypothetical protein